MAEVEFCWVTMILFHIYNKIIYTIYFVIHDNKINADEESL